MSNQVAKKQSFGAIIQKETMVNFIAGTLGDEKKARTFIASISSAVAVNPSLQECTPFSIINAALSGETLGLAHSPQMGQYYLVPFNNNKTKKREAVFQLGWKGYWQLAMNTGQYEKIVITEVKEGELIDINPFEEEITLKALGIKERVKAKTIGFYGMFKLLNGFTKRIFMSMDEMEHHAITYSQGYKAKKGYTFWEKNFDEMGKKTIIRQLISKYGIMSTEMQFAYERDMAVIREDGTIDYVDNQPEETGKEKFQNLNDEIEIVEDEKLTADDFEDVEEDFNFDDVEG